MLLFLSAVLLQLLVERNGNMPLNKQQKMIFFLFKDSRQSNLSGMSADDCNLGESVEVTDARRFDRMQF